MMDYRKKIQDAKRMVEDGNPKDACGMLRPVLEKYLAELCAKDNAYPVSDKIYDMIKALSDAGTIDSVKRSKLMHLKNLGNAGSHAGNEDVSPQDAKYFIEGLSDFLDLPEDVPSPRPIIEPQQPEHRANQTGSELHRQALISAYYLSEFGHKKLNIGNQTETITFIAEKLATIYNTLKNYRDYLDPITNSKRRGWWQVKTPPQFKLIFDELNGIEEKELRTTILRFIDK